MEINKISVSGQLYDIQDSRLDSGNISNLIGSASAQSDGLMSTSDKLKLDTIQISVSSKVLYLTVSANS